VRANIDQNGEHLFTGLRELRERHRLIGDVRGSGLMIGCELVTDIGTRQPATQQTAQLIQLCRERGVLIGKGGVDGSVLRIKSPPTASRGTTPTRSCRPSTSPSQGSRQWSSRAPTPLQRSSRIQGEAEGALRAISTA